MPISPRSGTVLVVSSALLILGLTACAQGATEYDNVAACQEYGRAVASFAANPNSTQLAGVEAAITIRIEAVPLADPELASAMGGVADVFEKDSVLKATQQEKLDAVYVVDTCTEYGVEF